MKIKFQTFFHSLLLLLLLSGALSLWAAAQTNTNPLATSEVHTNAAPGLPLESHQFGQSYLTFGLDRLPFLRDVHLLGEPLWKYIASLLYIFLAFYIAKIFDLIAFVWLRKFAQKTETKVDDFLLELLHGPV